MKKLLATLALSMAAVGMVGGTASASTGGPFNNMATLGRDVTNTVNQHHTLKPYRVARTTCTSGRWYANGGIAVCEITVSGLAYPNNMLFEQVVVYHNGWDWKITGSV